MSDARPYAVWPDPRSRSRSRVIESHSRGVDRQSRTGLNFQFCDVVGYCVFAHAVICNVVCILFYVSLIYIIECSLVMTATAAAKFVCCYNYVYFVLEYFFLLLCACFCCVRFSLCSLVLSDFTRKNIANITCLCVEWTLNLNSNDQLVVECKLLS